jgi:hypothetical protein
VLIGNSIYLDYQATTPLEPEVREAMAIYSEDLFANPHSAHFLGRQSAQAADMARSTVESCLLKKSFSPLGLLNPIIRRLQVCYLPILRSVIRF